MNFSIQDFGFSQIDLKLVNYISVSIFGTTNTWEKMDSPFVPISNKYADFKDACKREIMIKI